MLGIQLIGGTVSEALKQKIGIKEELKDQSGRSGIAKYAINEKNADRL
jgi:aarF domain-containing kinase